MAGLSFAAWFGEWTPLPAQMTPNGQFALSSNQCYSARTDDEANLLIAPRACFSDALISVRDSLLHKEPVQINLARYSALNTRRTRHVIQRNFSQDEKSSPYLLDCFLWYERRAAWVSKN